MLDYFIKVLLFQTLFLAVYDLLLKRETFFQWNRAYLLVTSLLAYVIPLLKINTIYEAIPQEYVVLLPEVLLSPSAIIKDSFDWSALLFTAMVYLFWIGVGLAGLLFVRKMYTVLRLIHINEKELHATYRLVIVDGNNAFSFFNYIFLGKALSQANKVQIIKHELIHVRQKHSLDLLFFELQKIICWFNPFSYLFQQRIAEIHEFIADAKAVKAIEKTSYFQNLMTQTFGTQKVAFINSFLKISLIKKRIIMLNKHRSKQVLKLKYLFMLPLLVGMLLYSSCEKQEEIVVEDTSVEEIIDEMKVKTDLMEMSANEINGLLDIIRSSMNNDELDERETRIKEQMYLYLLKKREALLANTDGNVITEKARETFENDELPFATVVNPPIFPGCEEADDPKRCFNRNVQRYVAANFDTGLVKGLGLKSGKKKIYVQFLIDKDGNVVKIKSRAPHKRLEDEAVRIVKSLPKMSPGKTNDGKDVSVSYMLPITFNVE